MSEYTPEEQRDRTLQAIQSGGLGVRSVWTRYFGLTGNIDEIAVDAYLNGLTTLPPLDRDLISHAVDELINETPPPAAPYSTDVDEGEDADRSTES